MAFPGARGHAEGMDATRSLTPGAAAAAEAVRLAAHELQLRAGAADAVPDLPATLAHVEDAVSRLATAMQVTGEAVLQRSVDEDDRPTPEARALSWHLYFLAARLRAAQEAGPAARDWALRLTTPELAASAAR
jgi:hypothetical protein